MDLCFETIKGLSEKLKNKEISSVELTESVFERIDSVEKEIDSYISVDREKALLAAQKADDAIAGGKFTPLTGIPAGIKDNISTCSTKTTCASKMLENYIPPYNATVIDKLDSAGAVYTGKLNMDEFAMGSSCENSAFKKTKNPHDTERIPGGSSGGSAASVAAGECIYSLGSDTGGSIRQPASYCGVVGMKPTYGAVSRYGLIAFASSLDQIGTITRSVTDAAIVMNQITGYDIKDSTSAKYEHPDYEKALVKGIEGLKIAVPDEFFGQGIEKEVAESVMRAAENFEKLGAVVKRTKLSFVDYCLPVYYIISSAEASSNLARFDGVKYGYRTDNFTDLKSLICKSRSEGFGTEVKRRILLGTYVLSSGYYDAYYKKAQAAQRIIKREFSETFENFDVILTPVTPDTAFRLGEKTDDPVKMYSGDICTVSINIAGLPAIVFPCGKDSGKLPIGVQLIGNRFRDDLLLKAAYNYEQSYGIWNEFGYGDII